MREAAFGHTLPGPMTGDMLSIDWPENTGFIRAIFRQIAERRQRGADGPQKIPHSEIEAALRRFGFALASWEHRALDAMEVSWIAAAELVISEDRERHSPPRTR